jgi:putative ABC transport system permease protein
VLAVLLGYLLLGIANKLVAATAARRSELATLRLIGASARQIWAMMPREAVLMSPGALTSGILLSVIPVVLASSAAPGPQDALAAPGSSSRGGTQPAHPK